MVDRFGVGLEKAPGEKLKGSVCGTPPAWVVMGPVEGNRLDSARNATIVVVGTAFATWLAHTFAAAIGVHVRERRPVRRHEIARKFGHSWRIITAALPATAVLGAADIGWISLRFALAAATLIGVIQLLWVGGFTARRSGFSFFPVLAY